MHVGMYSSGPLDRRNQFAAGNGHDQRWQPAEFGPATVEIIMGLRTRRDREHRAVLVSKRHST